VFVNDVRWKQVATLYGAGPHARVYTARLDDDGKTTVNFGDGKTTGARLPTGSNNVRAIYRKTMGTSGNIAAGKITSLLSRPLGLAGVTNPLASTGGVDRQQLADARGNAPHTVLTLDRVVSLRDYESFAMRFTGISKAVATWTWSGTERQVFLTVAGPAGITVDDATLTSLTRSIILHGRPYVPLRVVSYVPVLFKLKAKLVIERDLVPDIVLPRVRDAVKTAFAFEARNFGEAVDLSDIVKVIHGAGGVVSVDVDALHRSADPEVRSERLVAKLPRQDNIGNLIPAEILILDTADIREAQ
jgi:predicted phage baseplate assembly protein